MPLFDAPRAFAQRLQDYDRMLRIRWSDSEQRWRVERKVARVRPVDPDLVTAERYEDYVAAQGGYLGVLYCQKEQLDERVFFTLWYNDVQRRGGAKAVASQMEAYEAAYRKQSKARWLDQVYVEAQERYAYANTLSVQKRQLESWEGR